MSVSLRAEHEGGRWLCARLPVWSPCSPLLPSLLGVLVTHPPHPQAGLFVCCGRVRLAGRQDGAGCRPPTPGCAPRSCGRADVCVLGLLSHATRELGQRPGLRGQSGGGAWLQDLPSTSTATARLWGPLVRPAVCPSSQALGTWVLVGLSPHKKLSGSRFTAGEEQNHTSLLIFVGMKIFCI